MKMSKRLKCRSIKITYRLEMIKFLWQMKAMESTSFKYLTSIFCFSKRTIKQFFCKSDYTQVKLDKKNNVSANTNKEEKPVVQIGAPKKAEEISAIRGGTVNMKLPIVFIHFSNSNYLKYSLAQVKKHNPESTIFLLGDHSNDCYDFVEHHYISDYFREADYFSRIYQHWSTHSIEFELFCFHRWFVLKEFLAAKKLKKCLYLDSDTMLYANAVEEQKKFEHYDFTLTCGMSGNTFFLNRTEALVDFCKFLIDIYTKKDQYHYDKMLSHFLVRKKNNLRGGACDMTVFGLYNELHFGEIGETTQIIDGSVFDPNINIPHPGFEMDRGLKKIIWEKGQPFGIHLRSEKKIRFNSLHFQGKATRLISEFYNRGSE